MSDKTAKLKKLREALTDFPTFELAKSRLEFITGYGNIRKIHPRATMASVNSKGRLRLVIEPGEFVPLPEECLKVFGEDIDITEREFSIR